MTFDKDCIDGLLDTLILYLQSSDVKEYTLKSHQGWKITFKKLEAKQGK